MQGGSVCAAFRRWVGCFLVLAVAAALLPAQWVVFAQAVDAPTADAAPFERPEIVRSRLAALKQSGAAAALGASDAAPAVTEDLPAGVSQDWWTQAQRQIQEREYFVTWQADTALPGGEAAYQAPNRANEFRTYFTDRGVHILPRNAAAGSRPAWEVGLRLTAYGGQALPERVVQGEQGNRLEYDYGDVLTEWYRNEAAGLEQGFTLLRPPAGAASGDLTLELSLNGNLRPQLVEGGAMLDLRDTLGNTVLRYAGLKAWDAVGRELPVHMTLAGRTVCLQVTAAGAVFPITVDPLVSAQTRNGEAILEANQANAQFGAAVSAGGDINGDHYADVIVGAPAYDNGETDEGAVFVYYGSANGLSITPALTLESNQASAKFGAAVSGGGDFNGDTYVDLVVGAPDFDNGQTDEGAAYVYYGSATGLGIAAGIVLEGNQASARYGSALSASGNVNNDAYDDLLVGAPYYSSGQTAEGVVYVYHGAAAGLNATANLTLQTDHANAHMGSALSVGDVNGDGYSDAVIGSPDYATGVTQAGEGGVYVYLGSASGLSATVHRLLETNQVNAHLGVSVAVANVNGDGYGDVIAGAPDYDNGESNEGALLVYHGAATGIGSSVTLIIDSNQAGGRLGYALSGAGDVNGDGYGDVIAGAPSYDNGQANEGAAWVYYGSSLGLSAEIKDLLESDQAEAGLGGAVSAAGDVNQDGFADVIVGVSLYDAGQPDEGTVQGYYGSAQGVRKGERLLLRAGQASAYFGYAVSGIGDVNRDGYADVAVGAYLYDNGQSSEGAAFIYYGSIGGLRLSPNLVLEGNQTGACLGQSLSAGGDVNGDGYADALIAVSTYYGNLAGEGAIFVYYGSAEGLHATADQRLLSNQRGAHMGIAVSGAGDVNGDGYDDVIAGANQYNNGQNNEGGAYIFLGSASGVSSTPQRIVESNQAYAHMGVAVSGAGDVNGDGYDDVLVGAPEYIGTTTGRVFVYYGSATGIGATSNIVLYCGAGGGECGYAVAALGDVNGDGYSDVAVGAPAQSNGQSSEGLAYIYQGSASGLSNNAALVLEGNQASSRFGTAVSNAGDVNGDGYTDVLIGASYYDNGQTDEGAAFLYYGTGSGVNPKAQAFLESDQESAYFGAAVSGAGDVNGDGYGDVLVGAYAYDITGTNEGAAFVYYGAPDGLNSGAISLSGGQASAQFGFSLGGGGDINKDGYADVIVGAPWYDSGQVDEGLAYVYYGTPLGMGSTVGFKAEVDQPGAQLGYAVSIVGDVNQDGYADIAIGAPIYQNNGRTAEGVIFFYLGKASGVYADSRVRIESLQANAHFGASVSGAGDVNGDGRPDVIVGAPLYDNDQTDEGAVFVYYGTSSGIPSGATANRILESGQAEAHLGTAVSLADVNKDSYADILAGAPEYDNGQTNEGAALVYLGSSGGPAASPAVVLESNQEYAAFGESLSAAGDVNGDTYADVIVGAKWYDNGETNEGAAFIYQGSASGLNASASQLLEGNQAYAYFGAVSGAGDVNGDGYGDVIVGAYLYDRGEADEGAAFVYYGSASGLYPSLMQMEGDQADARFGSTVSGVGDIDNDGYADVLVGAPYYDTVDGQDRGMVLAYYGAAHNFIPDDRTLEHNQARATLGAAVSGAGDINKDGYADVLLGAPGYDNGETDEGAVFIYHGSAAGLGASATLTLEGGQAGAYFGTALGAAGDVNADGYADVIVGAPGYDENGMDKGAAFVYHGAAGGLTTTAAWTVKGEAERAALGYAVSGAGDVNQDGYTDVIVGAPRSGGKGKAYVYAGSGSGLGSAAAWSAEGGQDNEQFGLAVAAAGDVNKDGYSDVLVGAPGYGNGQVQEGRAYLYAGSTGGLGAAAAWSIESEQAGAHLGAALAGAGDVNRDGYGDLLIGAPDYDNGQSDEGRAWLYRGAQAGPGSTAAWSDEGNQEGAHYGAALAAAGDVNADGYGDALVGAPGFDGGQENEGRAYLYYGSPAGIHSYDGWQAESDQAFAGLGYALGRAGDINRDGYGDILIAAPQFDQGEVDEGAVFLFYGRP